MKNFFLTRALREKILVLGFVGLAALLWLSNVSKRGGVILREWRKTTVELTDQRTWLSNRAEIERRAAKAIKNLDPGQTINATRLLGELDTLARHSGLINTSIDSSRTEQANQFSVNTVQFAVRKADLGALLRFNDELAKRSPYIGLEACALQADAANPGLLNATLRVFSVEIGH